MAKQPYLIKGVPGDGADFRGQTVNENSTHRLVISLSCSNLGQRVYPYLQQCDNSACEQHICSSQVHHCIEHCCGITQNQLCATTALDAGMKRVLTQSWLLLAVPLHSTSMSLKLVLIDWEAALPAL